MHLTSRIKKIISMSLLTGVVMSLLTGCGGMTRQSQRTTIPTSVITYNNVGSLVDGNFYIWHKTEEGDEYYSPYAYRANFELGREDRASSKRTLWFKSDWNAVPTMYEGDKLIFKSSNTFREEFNVERYEYVGPTIGISQIRSRDSGRYYFDSSSESMGSGIIATNSDAYKLYELNSGVTVLNRLGGAQLKSGNISRGGLIVGLEKDKSYNAEIYVGTKQYDYPLKADMIALTSWETYTLNNYSFIDGKVAEVIFPSYFNTGYYLINGYGLIRYVKGTGYSESTDFNVVNIYKEEETTETEETEKPISNPNETKQETVYVDDNGETTIEIKWKGASEDILRTYGDIPNPKAKLLTDTGAYTFTDDGNSVLYTTASLAAGRYNLEISDLYSREYEINVYKGTYKPSQPEKTQENNSSAEAVEGEGNE